MRKKKPRKHPPDSFLAAEIAVAAGISPRNVEFLVSRELSPKAVVQGRRGANPSLWDSEGLAEWAIAGALHKAGVELVMAATLSQAAVWDFSRPRGFLPSGLRTNYANKRKDEAPFEATAKEWIKTDDEFWLHHFLRTRSNTYEAYCAQDNDWFIEIIDRKYVFTSAPGQAGRIGGITALGPSRYPIEPFSEIVGWERGSGADLRQFCHDINPAHETDRAAIEAREVEWFTAYKNAVGALRINAGLAIRNSFDRVHDFRTENAIELDWNATIKPRPGRYHGGDDKGRPLDPEHPWNRDLPPLERARRLVEIEEYIDKRERGGDES